MTTRSSDSGAHCAQARTLPVENTATGDGDAISEGFPPNQFDGYLLEREIGHGAMGEVYLAHDTDLDRHVAIKFMRFPNEAHKRRFRTEAKAAAALQHPNVVTVYGVGELHGNPYIVSEYIRGTSLDKLPKPVPWRQVYQLALDLARGLAAAHRHNVLHRDIKPANAVLSDVGVAKLIDFGVAKRISRLSTAEIEAASAQDSSDSNQPEQMSPPSDEAPPGTGVHTTPGSLIGTLPYMAPELWQNREEATPRTDIYSFGATLYELCSGYPPRRHGPILPLNNDIEAPFRALILRCLEHDPEKRFGSADELRDALEALQPSSPPPALPEGNPYRGVLPFEAHHRALFWGRTEQVRLVLDRLGGQPFVLLTGESGVGKSSLIRAGVLPRIEAGALDDGRVWTTHTLIPGHHPLANVTAWLAELLDVDERLLQREIESGDDSSLRHQLRHYHRNKQGTLLFVDQLEELITLAVERDEFGATRDQTFTVNESLPGLDRTERNRLREERNRVCQLLAHLAERTPGMRLIGTVRTDYVDRIAALPVLGPLVERALCILRPLDRHELREIIVEPARITGVNFESTALVDHLVEAAFEAEGGLPLLQFALAQLWEARDPERGLITEAAFERIGGVEGALARHADGVLDEMIARNRASAKSILLRLVSAHRTSMRCRSDELGRSRSDHRALEALVQGRLVVAAEIDGLATYQIAHEALINAWPRLRAWLDEQPRRDATLRQLQVSVAAWRSSNRSSEFLWGRQQTTAAKLLDHTQLTPEEQLFLRTSERAIRFARWRKHLVWFALAAVVIASYGVQIIRDEQELTKHLDDTNHTLRQARAQHDSYRRSRAATFGQLQANHFDQAQQLWRDTLNRIATVDDAYSRANRTIELALGMAPTRAKVRNLLGVIIDQQADFAEMTGRSSKRAQLVERLEVYAPALHRRWVSPVPVSVQTSPPGASVRITQYQISTNGPWIERDVSEQHIEGSTITPFQGSLPPGSYVLTIAADSVYAAVRYPLLVPARSPPLAVTVTRVATSDIPAGFIYIPSGKYLSGYGERNSQEDIRLWYEASPLHPRTTGPYLIARHETTIDDWLAYLEALPSQAPRPLLATPEAMNATGGAQIALSKLADGRWQLQFAPENKHFYKAISGQPFHYPGRPGSYRWEQFPISGISWNEAQIYLAWLRESKRVKNARLCRSDEWERAARGADRRSFPHGDRLAPGDANFDLTYARKPSAFGPDPVGSRPTSMSPFGLDDMAGNVWELVDQVADHKATTRSTSPDHRSNTTLGTGGSYYQARADASVYNRQIVSKDWRNILIGLRVCADIDVSPTIP